jgi:hypothetical protein
MIFISKSCLLFYGIAKNKARQKSRCYQESIYDKEKRVITTINDILVIQPKNYLKVSEVPREYRTGLKTENVISK